MKKQEVINFWKKLDISENNILEILEKVTGLTNSQLFLSEEIDNSHMEDIEKYFMRVVTWEPIEYILENANFYWLDFFVDSRTLIPRNDTEVMVDQVLEYIPENTVLIDVWTGSSCIPISILKNIPKIEKNRVLKTYVIDISEKALEVSKINIINHNLDNEVEQINWNLLDKISPHLTSPKGRGIEQIIITANLPYIKDNDFENMDEETVEFEPDLALYWWKETGFELYEKLIYQVLDLKKEVNEITLFIEIGFDQEEVSKIFLNKLNLQFEVFKDNSGVDRCVKIYF